MGASVFCVVSSLTVMLQDGDTGWHLGTGRWIVDHMAVPHREPFSFSAAGSDWIAHEWLSDVAMFAAWRAGGWAGLMLLFGAATGALAMIVVLYLRRWLATGPIMIILVYLGIGVLPSLLARPHLLALPLLAAWVVTLLRARERDAAPPLSTVIIMIIWANAHGSFVLGLGLVGVFALDALVEASPGERVVAARRWAVFGVATLIAALMTPNGARAILYPFTIMRMTSLPLISEWQPANFAHVSGFEIVLLSALFFLFLRPTRIPAVRLLLILALLHLGLSQLRQQVILMVIGALVLAEPIARAWHDAPGQLRQPADRPFIARLRRGAPALLCLALVAAGWSASRLIRPVERPETKIVPSAALRAVPWSLRHERVFNEYSIGGTLILDNIRPFIDGRSDMYGDAFTRNYARIAAGDRDRWRAAARRWHFRWTILPPDQGLVPILDREPGWRRLYADRFAVIHVATRPTPGCATETSSSPAATAADTAARWPC